MKKQALMLIALAILAVACSKVVGVEPLVPTPTPTAVPIVLLPTPTPTTVPTVLSTPIPNQSPVAQNDTFRAEKNDTLIQRPPGVLSNDSDAEGEQLTAVQVSSTLNGDLDFNPDGSFRYTPDSGFVGTDSFTYKVNDGETDSATATVTFEVSDTTPPETFIIDAPSEYANSASVSISFSASGDAIRFECRLDDGDWVTCSSPQTYDSLAEGERTFQVRADDEAGNLDSTPASVVFTLDTIPPTTIVTTRLSGITNDTTAALSFESSEADVSFECMLNEQEWQNCTSPTIYTDLAEGQHTLRIRSTDAASNVEEPPVSINWTVDSVSPEVSIEIKPSNPSNLASASFSFVATEAEVSFECKLEADDDWLPCGNGQRGETEFVDLVDGAYTFLVRAIDSASNTSAPDSWGWQVDTTGPGTTITDAPLAITNNRSASFFFISRGESDTFECKLNDGDWEQNCASPKSYTNIPQASHTFQVRASDIAGNVEDPPALYTWVVDLTPPTATIITSPPSVTNSTSATLAFDSSEADSIFRCSIDGTTFVACTSPTDYTNLTESQHTFQVLAVDTAGNQSDVPASYSWTVDATLPSVSITAGLPDVTGQTTASFSFSSGEAGGTFQCSLDGSPFEACTSPTEYAMLSQQPHTFEVRAVDAAGNTSDAPASASWEVFPSGKSVWARQFGSSELDSVTGVDVDQDGSVFVVGLTRGVVSGQSNLGGIDAFIRKYDSSGDALWTHQFGDVFNDSANDIAVDKQGNAYVVGFILPSAFLHKYEPDGDVQWTRRFGGGGGDSANGVHVDDQGNIYWVGWTDEVLPGQSIAGFLDAFVFKYDSTGSAIWSRVFGTSELDVATDVTSDSQGNVAVVGWTQGTLPGLTSAGEVDIFIRKYSSSGDVLWTRQFGTPDGDEAFAVTTDKQNNIYVAGVVDDALPGQSFLGDRDAFIRKYDASGTEMWTRQFGTTGNDTATGVAVDTLGNVYVGGTTGGVFPGASSFGADDVFIRKYDTSGNLVWTRQFGTNLADIGAGLALEADHNVYLAGNTPGMLQGQSNSGGIDVIVIKLTQ